MKVVLERVLESSVIVDGKVVGSIDKGYTLFVGFTHTDTIDNVLKTASKISSLRVFNDENGKMNKNIYESNGSILSISQFTLYGDATKGNRPSFVESMKYDEASKLYDLFNETLRNKYNLKVETGIFGADMRINTVCDGPVTIILEF